MSRSNSGERVIGTTPMPIGPFELDTDVREWVQQAMYCMEAVNLSGVAYTFHDLMRVISHMSHELNKGTQWKNEHPLAVLMIDKMGQLAGSVYLKTHWRWSKAYEWALNVQRGISDSWDYTYPPCPTLTPIPVRGLK